MENKEQGADGVTPQIQQAENVSYQQEVKDSQIDMNPLHGAEAEAHAAEIKKDSMVVEPNVGQRIVEPLTGSAVIVEEKPKPEVPDNGFPIGYGPNEHMKKIEKPKAPSFRERMKHTRKKMTKKQKILAIAIPGATVVLIGGFMIVASFTGMFKVDYSGTYLAAKELKSELQGLRSDTNCDKVIEYVDMQYTAMETYMKYIEGCKVASEGVSDSVVAKVGDTDGVRRDEEIRRRYETLKTSLETAKQGNANVNGVLDVYKIWHEWILAEAAGDNKHAEWEWTESDLNAASEILTKSDIKEFQEYGKKWLELKKAAAEATSMFFHPDFTQNDLPTLTQNMNQKQDEFKKWKKENEPDVTDLYPLELVDTAKLYAKFEEFYNYIRDTYEKNYNTEVRGCTEFVTSVKCD